MPSRSLCSSSIVHFNSFAVWFSLSSEHSRIDTSNFSFCSLWFEGLILTCVRIPKDAWILDGIALKEIPWSWDATRLMSTSKSVSISCLILSRKLRSALAAKEACEASLQAAILCLATLLPKGRKASKDIKSRADRIRRWSVSQRQTSVRDGEVQLLPYERPLPVHKSKELIFWSDSVAEDPIFGDFSLTGVSLGGEEKDSQTSSSRFTINYSSPKSKLTLKKNNGLEIGPSAKQQIQSSLLAEAEAEKKAESALSAM